MLYTFLLFFLYAARTSQNDIDVLSIENRFYAKSVNDLFDDAAYSLNSTLFYIENITGIRKIPLVVVLNDLKHLTRRCSLDPYDMDINSFRIFDAFMNADTAYVYGQKIALLMNNVHERLLNIYVYVSKRGAVVHNTVTLDESSTLTFTCSNMTPNAQHVDNFTKCLAAEFDDNLNATNQFVRKFIAEEFKINGLFDDIEHVLNKTAIKTSNFVRNSISPPRRRRRRNVLHVIDCVISITRLFYNRLLSFYSVATNKLIYIAREMPKLSKR